MDRSERKLSKKAVLLTAVFLFIIAWAAVMVFAVGGNNVIAALQSRSPGLIHAFGSFGAAFGILAALFAGWAAVSVVLSLEVQQRELHELRKQMELDRDLSTFTRLLEIARSVRANLKDKNPDSTLEGSDVINDYFSTFQRLRGQGDFDVEDALSAMKDVMHDVYNSFSRHFGLTFSEYFNVLEEIARFLANSERSERERFRILLKSVISFPDLMIFHEHLLLNRGRDIVNVLVKSALFYEVGMPIYVTSKAGPLFPPEVYGPDVLERIGEGKISSAEFRFQ